MKISRWCDYQERSQQETRDKLYALGLHRNEVENLLAKLVTDGFVNEERFAKAYARGKFRISEWGRIKIRLSLQQKKISDYCIKVAMAEIPEEEYLELARKLLHKKLKTHAEAPEREQKHAAARYLYSRGFEKEIVYAVLQLDEE